ncbi:MULTISPECIES: caspase family protein [Kitasatospora]|uniref:Peptidase C14 caspase domain-containing protein n=1 Tax=Kitasatospora setae (strain ATCC 33774 / DSM 43861 / JCM 3304 / KCC A-0304 / NBRC 14216 / KM-6054) TaxID=452652 RepID=E4NAP7_KITSK|nr:caspase family protein [Kitasatospora setae]BAJ28278.1 hypothetical protein KSE_24640 [Kitasatospora setae KM-6054]
MADYPQNREWDRPGLAQARERVVELFTTTLGYRLHDPLPLSPTKQELTNALRRFCAAPERREDDLLALYLSCHGEILGDGEEHVLLTADTDPEDLAYTALPTAELTRVLLRGTRIRRVLLMLDACYVGQGGNEMAAAALERVGALWGKGTGSGLVVVSSAQPHQPALAGAFPQLLEDAVASLPVAGHGPQALSVNALVQHMNDSTDRPGYQRIGLTMVGLDGEAPPFFPNPRHDVRLTEVDLALQQTAAFDEQDRRRETELVSRLLVRAMGYHRTADEDVDPAWWFSGRHTALRDLAAWLNHPADHRDAACRVVTAAPGSGKTAVLGLIAALSHPERHRTVPTHTLGLPTDLVQPGTIDAAVYAQRLSDSDVLDALNAAARTRATTVGELLEALTLRPRPLTVLIDALDEAASPDTLTAGLLRPLIEHSQGRIRLLLGTRPYLLPRLGTTPEQAIDLDDDRYADPQAITAYAIRTLLEAHRRSPYRRRPSRLRPVAEAVAEAADRSFLVARITAATLAATPTIPDPGDPHWRASLPRYAGDAMHRDLHRRLGPDAQRAIDLLRPLAYAQGQGLPWEDIWAPLATETSGRPCTDDDILWLRHQAGSYVVEATENGRSAYRLYHEAMAEYLRQDTDPQGIHAAYTHVLTSRVPYRADATRDWSRAHPYALAHIAYHAAQAGLLDQVLTDTEYLVHADPRGLTPHLHHADSPEARLNAAVYRTGLHLHHEGAPSVRRQVLALNAASAGATDLHNDLTHRIPVGTWTPRWATGSAFSPALRHTLTGHNNSVTAVACTALDGRPVAVTTSHDETVRVWDLATGQPLGQPLTGHTANVLAVACTALDGRPVAVTTGVDRTVRVWDLATGQPLGQPLTGHTDEVAAVACTALDGRPVAVTSSHDKTVRVWDLATGQPLGQPLTGHTETVYRVACTELDGRPVAVTASWDETVRVWDLATGQPFGEPLTGHLDEVLAVACTALDGRPVAVTTGADSTVRVWDLATGQPLGQPLTGHLDEVLAVACTALDGRPVAVTTGADSTVRVWDLATGQPLGQPLTGHTANVLAVACTVFDGRTVAVTTSHDKTVRVWNLATGQPLGQPLTGHPNNVTAVTCTLLDSRPVAVTTSWDGTVRVWDLATGQPLGEPLTGHTRNMYAVACTELDGRPVAVTAGWDDDVWVWDLATGRPVGEPLTDHTGAVPGVACTELDGRPVAVTAAWDNNVRVWNLVTRQLLGKPLTGHTSNVNAVACTELNGRPVAVTGSADQTVRVWDLATGRPVGEPLADHTGAVLAVACTVLDGRPVAVTTGADSTVRVWDLATGQPLGKPLTDHTGTVLAVACTVLDGRTVAVTTSRDNTVRVWDLATQKAAATIPINSPGGVAITAAGDLIVSLHSDVAHYRRRLSQAGYPPRVDNPGE